MSDPTIEQLKEAMKQVARMVMERGCGPVICLWRDQDGNHLVTQGVEIYEFDGEDSALEGAKQLRRCADNEVRRLSTPVRYVGKDD